MRNDILSHTVCIARDLRDTQQSLNLNGVSQVLAAMPGVGKSTLMKIAQENGFKVVDSDSQRFSFLTNEQGQYIDREGKIVTTKQARIANPNFVSDYVAHIREMTTQNDLVFVSAHEAIRDALAQGGIQFDLVRYEEEVKDEVVARIRNRKSAQPNEIIANVLSANWDKWMETIDKPGPRHIFVLGSGQYLNDILGLDVQERSLNPDPDALLAAKTRTRTAI